MKLTRVHVWNLALAVAAFALAAFLYDRIPDPAPTHWNARGEADGFTPKPWGVFFLPLILLGNVVLLMALPKLSPRGFGFDRFLGAYAAIATALTVFLFLVSGFVLLAAAGVPVPIDRVMPASIGALLVVIGNFLGKVTKNFFVGIRTPWTLTNEEVWLRTHRLGGRLFVAAGLVMMVGGLAGVSLPVLIVPAVAAAIVPAVYSYFVYRRLERGA